MAWMSVVEAARKMSCSEGTVRRRIQDGRLQSEHRNGRAAVWIEDDQIVADIVSLDDVAVLADKAAADVRRLDAMLDSLTDIDRRARRESHSGRRLSRLAPGALIVALVAGGAFFADFTQRHRDEVAALLGRRDRAEGVATARLETVKQLKGELSEARRLVTESAHSASRARGQAQALRSQLALERETVRQLRALKVEEVID